MNKLIRKISPATVAADLLRRLDIPNSPDEVVLYDVYGVANRVRVGDNGKGEWTQFKGQFECIVADSGEVFTSGACHLQKPFDDMLFGQLQAAQQVDPNASIKFACRVSIVPPTKGKPSAVGYEYRVQPLLEAGGDSPLTELRKLVAEQTKMLSA